MASIQHYTAFVERSLQEIEHDHKISPMLVAGQVLSIVLTDLVRGTENEADVRHLTQLWHQAVASEEGLNMPLAFTVSAIRETVESEG